MCFTLTDEGKFIRTAGPSVQRPEQSEASVTSAGVFGGCAAMSFTLPGSAGSSVVLAVLLAPPWSEAGRLVAFLLSVSVAAGRGVFARPLAVALGLDNRGAMME